MRVFSVWLVVLSILGGGKVVLAERSPVFSNDTFGAVRVDRHVKVPRQVFVYFSGGPPDEGMGRALRTTLEHQGGIVITIDARHYLRSLERGTDRCAYLAGEIVRLSQTVQSELMLPSYRAPVVIGDDVGAALAYTVLAQHPPDFLGGLGVRFCPRISIAQPICKSEVFRSESQGRRQVLYPPVGQLNWMSLDEPGDPRCPDPEVGHSGNQAPPTWPETWKRQIQRNFFLTDNWTVEFNRALDDIIKDAPETVADGPASLEGLPVHEISLSHSPGAPLVVFYSGDGGWASIDQSLSSAIARANYSVVGFDSLRYFWHRKSPEEAARDLGRVIQHFTPPGRPQSVVLIGFSYGADVLPFLVNRLAKTIRARLRSLILLSASGRVDFEVHIGDWLGIDAPATYADVVDEMGRLQGVPIYCFFGSDDSEAACRNFGGKVKSIEFPGDHHFGGDYEHVAKSIFDILPFNERP